MHRSERHDKAVKEVLIDWKSTHRWAIGTHVCQLCLIHSAKHRWCREVQLVHGCVLLLIDCQQLQFLLYGTWIPLILRRIGPGRNCVCLLLLGVIGFGLRLHFCCTKKKRGGGASFQGQMAYCTEVQPVSDSSGNGRRSSGYEKPLLMPPENIVM